MTNIVEMLRANRTHETNFADIQLCILAANIIEEQVKRIEEQNYKIEGYKWLLNRLGINVEHPNAHIRE